MMFSESKDFIWPIFLALMGVYCIFLGIKTILTGSLTAREEARIQALSMKGSRIYRLVYSIINIIGGLLIVGLAAVMYLSNQGVITDTLPYKLGVLAVVIVLAVVLIITKSKCKKMTDDQ